MKKLVLLVVLLVSGCCGSPSPTPLVGRKPPSDPCATPKALATALGSASQAAVLDLGVDPLQCPEVQMSETWAGGKLIFSDSPEHPASSGKVYEDTTLGATVGGDFNRVFLYHTNGLGGSDRMKWTVLIKNNGSEPATLTVQKSGTAGPTTSYLYAGKMAFQRWLDSSPKMGVPVGVGEAVRLDVTFDTVTTAPTYLMHGIWDYSMTQAHTVTICALGQNDDPLQVCPGLSVLPRDTHQRGTCPYTEKTYDTDGEAVIETADNVQQLPLAGGGETDTYLTCVDKTDQAPQVLTGNYGVLYRLHLATSSHDGRKLSLLMNPRGGTWGGAVWAAPGVTPGGKFLIPDGTGSVSQNTQGAVEGKYDPGSGLTTWMQWMPTGGSSLPLRLVAAPY